MFQRGRLTDPVDYKGEVLKKFPNVKVKRKITIHNLTGYILYDGEKHILSRRSARQCWEDFYCRKKDEGKL